MSRWYVYIIECRDGSLYTGIATDVDRRYAEHAAGKGARYTRSRPPVRLLARFEHPDRAAASRAEHAIKQLTPARSFLDPPRCEFHQNEVNATLPAKFVISKLKELVAIYIGRIYVR